MIAELQPTEFNRVLSLYHMTAMSFPLISAVIQQKQRGQVFANERDRPAAALVVTNFGFMFWIGAEQNELFDEGLRQIFSSGDALKPSYLLWYSPPAAWQTKLDGMGSDSVRRRERVRLECRAESDSAAGSIPAPVGFELKDLTLDLIPKTEKFGVKLDSRFWTSCEDFVENGLGICLVKDGEVVSLCYAAAIVDSLAEVDVATDPEFRGRGLASVVTREFIKRCMNRGIVPTWDCFEYNAGSIKLARKLGFLEVVRYPFYTFNIPLALPGGRSGSAE